ncbi:MAG TPA: hypothetical protein VMR70_06910 [Flavisolibacter sp.]|nr:hypothetical protein [Flavisolibacter sp.]
MSHLLTVVFRKEDIQKLLELNPDKIVVRTALKSGKLASANLGDSGESVGYVVVEADAVNDDSEKPLGTVEGCPVPPCG